MTDRLTIALATLNPVVGDLGGNAAKIQDARALAAKAGADLVICGELGIVGYPPEDLVLKPSLQARAREAVEELAALTADGGPALLVGSPWVEDGKLYNSALLLQAGSIKAIRHKHDLPNYGVFDEMRIFTPGPLPEPVDFRTGSGAEIRLGVMICEDMWKPEVAKHLAAAGAEILLIPNGSPFEDKKMEIRLNHAVSRVAETKLPLVYVNQVGGQDELVFDGASFVLNPDCRVTFQSQAWIEDVSLTHWQKDKNNHWQMAAGKVAPYDEGYPAIYAAMVLGLKDYIRKNKFPGVILGLSGGIDSALTAAVAVDALGKSHVQCVMMPSRFTSPESLEDAAAVAGLLGLRYDSVPIEEAVGAFGHMLADLFKGRAADATEENIQARIRGIILMAISNKFGYMLLTTGNKSEMSVGYATLYGDMAGGFSVLKDIYKVDVFALSRWRNAHKPEGALGPEGRVMPERVIDKIPTAELRANQTDQDSLPPYEVLDDILHCLIELELGADDIVARGHDPVIVAKVEKMLNVAEYKRRQAPPGVKLTRRNFGRDRRYPITNAFRSTTS
jgi:NAD+ synthase